MSHIFLKSGTLIVITKVQYWFCLQVFFLYILQSNQVEFTLPAVKNVCRTDVAAIFVVLTPVNDKQHRVQQVLYLPAVYSILLKGQFYTSCLLLLLSTITIVRYCKCCTVSSRTEYNTVLEFYFLNIICLG